MREVGTMIEARIPDNESERLAALRSYDILDTDPERAFDDLTEVAAQLCGTPISLVSLVDAERQWFKSRVGLEASETPRRVAFCSHAILEPDQVLIVPDACLDERFADNPITTGDPLVRFYAGAPLVDAGGLPLGTLCVIDHRPRELSEDILSTLQVLARQVVSQLELRRRALDLRALTEQLDAANKHLHEFASVAAHDLREPLRKVGAFGHLLRVDLGADLPERAAECLAYIEDAIGRMERLTSDLLDLARSGGGEITWRKVDLLECAIQARNALAVCMEESEATVSIESLPEASGDAVLLTQLFQNLISNALKFVEGRKPVVQVRGHSTPDGIEIVVHDNGIGMEAEHAEQIFGPLSRLHGRNRFEGSGIGLAIVSNVVERHGGRVWVESTPGEGSRFHVAIPHAPEPEEQGRSLGNLPIHA